MLPQCISHFLQLIAQMFSRERRAEDLNCTVKTVASTDVRSIRIISSLVLFLHFVMANNVE